tara:strand:- start:1318 stop:1680 length:363 start_codon:yes stop_codon:yes gene_type:complete
MGTAMWYLQRATSLVILSYIIYILYGYIFNSYSENGSLWFDDIRSIPMKIFTILFVTSLFIHSVQGLKAVEDDYLSERTLGFVSPDLANFSKIFRFIYRFFIALVIFVLTYVLTFNYMMS